MFSLLVGLVLAVTVIIIPMFAPYNYVLMLPSLLLVCQNWAPLWKRDMIARIGCVLIVAAVAWPWIAAIGLIASSAFLPAETVQQHWWLPLYTIAKIPMPIVCLIPLSVLVAATWQHKQGPVLEPVERKGLVA